MNPDLAIVLGLLALAIAMFALNKPRMDSVGLIMRTALPLTGVITMGEARAGFSDPNIVRLGALFVLSLIHICKVLLVPEQAIVPDTTTPFVFVVQEGKAMRVPVKTGTRRNAQVEIVEGLKAGDEVVTAGQMKLRDGAPVKAVGGQAAPGTPMTAAPPADKPAIAEGKAAGVNEAAGSAK